MPRSTSVNRSTGTGTIALLVILGLADIAAAPAMLSMTGSDKPPAFFAVLTAVLGVLTIVAAIGIVRGAAWAVPLAVGTRVVDIISALPGLGAGVGQAITVSVVGIVSVLAIVLLLRSRRTQLAPSH